MSNLASKSMRVVKNYAKGFSDSQAKVREATSNDPWGPSGTQMNELAQLTYNQNDFVEIMEMLDKRLNDKGKNWRHVFKSLTLLDYLLHAGSENVVYYFKDNAYIIKTLKEFQHVDDDGRDQGANVRQKAKDISNLLSDDSRLRDQRKNRAFMRDRMTKGAPGTYGPDEDYELGVTGNRPRSRSLPQRRRRDEDDDLARALEASMRSQEDEQRKLRAGQSDDDLARALRLSQEEEDRKRAEEARRKAELDNANANALFDDSTQIWSPNAYNQPQQVDFFGNPIQSQPTGGFAMADMSSLQPQMTSFNPFQQQQEAMAMQQQQMMLQQQQQLAAQQQQQQQQQQQAMFTGMLSPQPLQEQKTGYRSNNPFATHLTGNTPVQTEVSQASPQPAIPANFAPSPSLHHRPSMPNLPTSTSADFGSSPPRNPGLNLKTNDAKHENISNALASGSGSDTFGNEGLLRIPTGAAKFAPQKTGGASPFGASLPSAVTGTGGGSTFTGQAQSAFSQPAANVSTTNNNNPWTINNTSSPFGQPAQQKPQTETPFFTL